MLSITVDQELAHFDLSLIKRLAFQRLQQIALKHKNEQTEPNENFSVPASTVVKLENETNDDNEKLTHDLVSKVGLDYVINESHRNVGGSSIESGLFETNNEDGEIEGSKTFLPAFVKLEKGLSSVRSRAVLTPITNILNSNKWLTDTITTVPASLASNSIPIRYRSLTIGTGPGNDVVLGLYGHCSRTSTKHAVIFYDDVTRFYELLNYSEFGTEVNGQMYSCNLSEFKSSVSANIPQSVLEANACAEKNAREILDKHRGVVREKHELDANAK